MLIERDGARCVRGGLRRVKMHEGHDREQIAHSAQMRRGSVEDDLASPGLAGNDVGLEPVAVSEVCDEHLLKG